MTNLAYRQILKSYFDGDNRALERFVKDRNHPLCEINLVRARQHLRKGKYAIAWEILKSIGPNSDFTKAEVAILKASVHSYHSRWQEAIEEALLALKAYTFCGDERGLFVSNYNLSVYYGRLGFDKDSNRFLRDSESWMRTPTQKSLVHRAEACALVRELKFALAVREIEKALSLREQMDPVDLAALLNVAADVYFRAGENSSAIALLEEIAQSKVIRDKARVRFDLLVLRALVKNQKQVVPSTCPEWIQSNEEYFLRWEVLSSLQSGQINRAESAWERLVTLFPFRFQSGFRVIAEADEKMLFIQAIRWIERVPQAHLQTDFIVTGKAKQLLTLLQSAKTPLRKEEMIEHLWQMSYEPSLDNRFYKLMGRLRKQKGVQVEVILNTYRLAR